MAILPIVIVMYDIHRSALKYTTYAVAFMRYHIIFFFARRIKRHY